MSTIVTRVTRSIFIIVLITIGSLIGYYLYANSANDQLHLVQSRGCASCHGTQGQGNPSMQAPQLAGQTHAMLTAKLKAYQNGDRDHAIMATMVWRLNDQELYLLADYFSQFSPAASSSQTTPLDVTP